MPWTGSSQWELTSVSLADMEHFGCPLACLLHIWGDRYFNFSLLGLESESKATQSCPALCDPMDCSLPGSSIHGIFQARILEGCHLLTSPLSLFLKMGRILGAIF